MSKNFKMFLAICVATLFGHYLINVHNEIRQLKFLLSAADQKDRIQTDQVAELISDLRSAEMRNQGSRTEGYVAGVTDMIQKPDYYNTIWHNGYSRGSDVAAEAIKAGQYQIDGKSVKTEVIPVNSSK